MVSKLHDTGVCGGNWLARRYDNTENPTVLGLPWVALGASLEEDAGCPPLRLTRGLTQREQAPGPSRGSISIRGAHRRV